MRNLINNAKFRSIFFQALTVSVVLGIIMYLFANMATNMEKRGIPIGFGFLFETSGFGILQIPIPYSESSTHGRVFLVGLINTLLVASVGVVLTTIWGFLVGISRLSNNWLMVRISGIYIEIFRNLPILLQILFWNTILRSILPNPTDPLQLVPGADIYLSIKSLVFPKLDPNYLFLVMMILLVVLIVAMRVVTLYARRHLNKTGQTFPDIWVNLGGALLYIGVFVLLFKQMFIITPPELTRFGYLGGSHIILEFVSLTFSLSFYHATYIAEQVRASIEAVDKGQKEAASAIGLADSAVMRRIVFPQAMRSLVPPLINVHLNLIKNSSLATAIGYPDLVAIFAGTSLNQSGRALEIMFMTMLVYLTLSLIVSVVMNWYNKRIKLIER